MFPYLARRSSKGYMAQLMRVFVAVPEGPVEVHLRPMVQPAPAPCPTFNPGKDALKIPQGDIWVLRLPYPFKKKTENVKIINVFR